jgi:hypothetical protein
VYAAEDESAPDAIFDEIIKGLTDDANAQYEAMSVEPEPSGMYYVMKQFQRVE